MIRIQDQSKSDHKELSNYQQAEIIKHSIQEKMSLVFSNKETGYYQLRLGVLDKYTAFAMKLRLRAWLEGEVDCPAGLAPRQLLVFVTTRDLEKDGKNADKFHGAGGTRTEPLTKVFTIDKDDEDVIIHGEDGNGNPKTRFGNLAQIWRYGMFSNARGSFKSVLVKEIQNQVEILITPAVVFAPETNNMETPASSASVHDSHSGHSDNKGAIVRCSGLAD
ncbi:hypothetical protein NX722_10720 [Endozoicomonas gorgoniicola]|uniref:Uncharacterized protein n=1 Tax=Endozoicomonas gorgoniicola TaxID=1234144 RepID=A0ABT3MUP5_9GAMM|nr:hypothetical protein [Endozoicomonas gorgoniicola]MCW7553098.1 hypothetical protein [Endozoicomonas gorgoniicola]